MNLRVLVMGAHPDDADVHVAGTAYKLARAGATVRFFSFTSGDKGHFTMSPEDLAKRRYGEAQASARLLGIDGYDVGKHPDCELVADLDLRREVTRYIRKFAPHIIFAHRTCDYHADHRAAATVVMDATYLLGVPHWCPEVPVPSVLPAVFLMRDTFTYPRPLRADVIVPIDDVANQVADALACHESQFFEWLAQEKGIINVPKDALGRRQFIFTNWLDKRHRLDAQRFYPKANYVEIFERSEYGRQDIPFPNLDGVIIHEHEYVESR